MGHGLRIGLDSEFAGQPQELRHGVEQFLPEVHSQQRRSAAPDEDGLERMPDPRAGSPHLGDQPVDELRLPVLSVDNAVEVAVMALVKAKRHMQIGAVHTRFPAGATVRVEHAFQRDLAVFPFENPGPGGNLVNAGSAERQTDSR